MLISWICKSLTKLKTRNLVCNCSLRTDCSVLLRRCWCRFIPCWLHLRQNIKVSQLFLPIKDTYYFTAFVPLQPRYRLTVRGSSAWMNRAEETPGAENSHLICFFYAPRSLRTGGGKMNERVLDRVTTWKYKQSVSFSQIRFKSHN